MTTLLLVLSLVSLFCFLTSPFIAFFIFGGKKGEKKERKNQTPPPTFPPVTLLKPLSGYTDGSYESFDSYCKLDYPIYQLIFSVQSDQDPIIPTVEKFIKRHQKAGQDIELVISSHRIGINPKVNNLFNAYQKAKYDTIVYNDSDTAAFPNYLKEVVPPLADTQTGMVTCVPVYRHSKNWAAAVETVGMNANIISAFGIPTLLRYLDFCSGVTIAVRRNVLEEVGGFRSLANNICDDGFLAKKIFKAGYRVHLLSKMPVYCVHHYSNFKHFYEHLLRWFVTIRAFSPFKYLLSFPMFGIFYAILYGIAEPGWPAFFLILSSIVGRYGAAAGLNFFYIHDQSTWKYLWLLPLHDFALIPAWLQGWFSSKVKWRGKIYHVQWGGNLVPPVNNKEQA